MSSIKDFRSPLIEKRDNNSEIVQNDDDFLPEIFPSYAGGYDLNYKSYPRPEKFTAIQGNLRSILEIPAVFRHIFSHYTTFNQIQSRFFDDAFYSDIPLIVSAPTGSGKTVLFELAIIRSLMNLEDLNIKDFKIIYLAPIKALCHERLLDWQTKFNHLGVSCVEATGDHDISDLSELAKYKIIITTPEKWDTLTRRWKDFQHFVSEIKLFLIDEVHLVNENERGATLEVILSRMKTISSALNHNKLTPYNVNLRFVAVSATLPNIEDVALWIGGAQAKFHKMPEEMRPIQLEKIVFGYPSNSYATYFRFDMSLNYKLSQLIQQYSGGKPTLIFCSTRKGVEMAANVLSSTYSFSTPRNSTGISELVERISDAKLVKLLSKGIAYHHAGLLTADRVLIEDSFRNGSIPVLLCTSTLATGVNLPAHLVILKSTQAYSQTGTDEYPESLIFQMIGRAGRPQYDNSGVAIIMTQNNKVKLYENMVSGVQPVESNLHKHLPEHLNAEIVLRTITDLGVALQWIKSTFLYVRAIKNPSHYGFASGLNKEKVEQKLEELCLIGINSLEKHRLLTKDQLYGLTITPTVSGRIMARCYLNFNTMKVFQQMTGNDGLIELMLLISQCHEFSDCKLRASDKRYLNGLNCSKTAPLRFPIKGKVKTISDKILILLQAVLGNISCFESSLYQEVTKIIRVAEKIAKAMVQYTCLSEHNLSSNQFKSVYSTLVLSKCCTAKMWENSPFVSKQLNKIGNTYSKLLVEAGKTTFENIFESSARELETILHRPPPFGNLIQEAISKLPYFNIDLILINSNFCRVKIRQTNTDCLMSRSYYEKIAVIVGDSKNNLLFLKENISFFLLDNKEFERNIKIIDPNVDVITAHVIHSNLVGLDKHTTLLLSLPPTESQDAFKTKFVPKAISKKSVTKNKNTSETTPLTIALQPINPNTSSINKTLTHFDSNHDCDCNQNHDNHNDDKDHIDDYFDIEVSQQQMIFNKCRDQGIDHDRNKNLNKSNSPINSNTTLTINGNRSSSSPLPLKKKFIKKTKISKNDFTTIIVPSQSEKKLSTQQNELENENEICTKLPNANNGTYRIVEILEKKMDKPFIQERTNSENNNLSHEIIRQNDHDRKQYYTIDKNYFQNSVKVDDDVRKQDLKEEQDLNFNTVKMAATPVIENVFGACENKFNAQSSQTSQLKTYNCSVTNREEFPSTPSICSRQRSKINKPDNYINLLKSICDRDAFSDTTNIVTSKLLNVTIIEEEFYGNEQPEIDYNLLLSQRNFMEDQEQPSNISNKFNSSSIESKNIAHLKRNNEMVNERRGIPFREVLNSYDYEKTKKPKMNKPNYSIMNFIDNDDTKNVTSKRNEFKTVNSVPSSNRCIAQSSDCRSSNFLYRPFNEPSPTVQRKNQKTPSPNLKDNDNYTTPRNQKFCHFSSATPAQSMDGNNSYSKTSENTVEQLFNTTITENSGLLSFLNPSPSCLLFSQTNPKEMEMWEQNF